MKRCLLLLGAALCAARAEAGVLAFTTYHTPAQVDAALTTLNTTYPSLTSIVTLGSSLGGLPIKALKISSTPAVDDPNKGDVVFVGLHHAREWISVEMALYLADELLARRASDAELQADMDQLQIWIVPVVNPDGYNFTTTPGNRYWRKNRRNNGDGTFGVDLNRNWGYQWGLLSGSSNVTSDDTYHGSGAFSEPELVVLRNFLLARQNLKAFMSYHSYSELFLRPWAYTTSDPPGRPTLESVANRNISRIASVHGHTYGPTIWYTSSGEATDWHWNQFRIASFTTELRPAGSLGLAGFSPPDTTILPSNEENLPSALALVHDAGRSGIWIKDHAADTGHEPSAVWTGSGWSHAFWESPDISTTPPTLTQGATVTLNVTVHNSTGATQTNVTVDAYYTDPRISLEFPNPVAVLIGSQTVTLPPGDTTLPFSWTVPVGTNSWGELHWCVGVVIKHDRDMPLSTQVQKTSNVGCRNFHTLPLLTANFVMVAAQNFLAVPAEVKITVDQQSLPAGWKALIALPPHPPPEFSQSPAARKARLLGANGPILEPGETLLIPVRVEPPPNVPPGTEVDLRVHGALLPLIPGKREPLGNGFTYRVVK